MITLKIKEVCEQTGLSDKTIRYYIRCGLVFPKYNENYTGRKNFDFGESDIERLNQVAVLRKYGFSINSIKSILNDSGCIDAVIKEHILSMKKETENSVKLLSRLDDISDCQFSNTADLCEFLSKAENLPAAVPSDDNKRPYKLLYSKNKKANRILIALVVIVVLFSTVSFIELYDSVRNIADWSAADMNSESITIDNENYETADNSWTPYGEAYYDGEYYLFKNGTETIFAKTEESSLFEPLIYHNTNDVYPDISMKDKIDKIVLQIDNNQITLDSNMTELLVNELSNADNSKHKTASADISAAEVYINVFYKDYPAYQNEFVLCYSNDNELGFMYCETEKNTNKFGENNMALFSNKELTSYINSLNLL